MLVAKGWTPDGNVVLLKGRQANDIFDDADIKGCVRVQDGSNEVFAKIQDEWVGLYVIGVPRGGRR